jgi:hypothetical protein
MQDPIEKQLKQKDWWCGSSGRAPTWQVQGPDFQLQYYRKKEYMNFKLQLHNIF